MPMQQMQQVQQMPMAMSPEANGSNDGQAPMMILLMAEIRKPPRMMIIPLFIGFHTSQVVQDFSHQQ